MKKEDLASLLKLTGVDDNAVTLAMNAYEIGYEEAVRSNKTITYF